MVSEGVEDFISRNSISEKSPGYPHFRINRLAVLRSSTIKQRTLCTNSGIMPERTETGVSGLSGTGIRWIIWDTKKPCISNTGLLY
jgi:hypothetical protein